jgi:hypothetical protein
MLSLERCCACRGTATTEHNGESAEHAVIHQHESYADFATMMVSVHSDEAGTRRRCRDSYDYVHDYVQSMRVCCSADAHCVCMHACMQHGSCDC